MPKLLRKEILLLATIEGHLAWYVGNGEIDINKLVSIEKQMLIKEAAKIHGTQSLKTLIENLPGDISYGEIRLVLAAEKEI